MNHNYSLLLLGRFIFGLSDSVSIFQHTILCYWFSANKLPFVFGLLLFLVKGVRAVNDNVASMFYNATGYLPAYFWLGLLVSLLSLISAYYLTTIHESVTEVEENNATKEKQKEIKEMIKEEEKTANANDDV